MSSQCVTEVANKGRSEVRSPSWLAADANCRILHATSRANRKRGDVDRFMFSFFDAAVGYFGADSVVMATKTMPLSLSFSLSLSLVLEIRVYFYCVLVF